MSVRDEGALVARSWWILNGRSAATQPPPGPLHIRAIRRSDALRTLMPAVSASIAAGIGQISIRGPDLPRARNEPMPR
jgi:hypothetical protein